MTSFSEEVRRGKTLAARTRVLVKMEDSELRRMWGSNNSMLSIKILMSLTAVVYLFQLTITRIHDGTGTAFESVMGNAVFLPCVCIFGVVAAFMIQMDHCPWKLVLGTISHCLCSAAISAYVFLFMFTVSGPGNDVIPKDDSTNNAATILLGVLCCTYILISFMFLGYTYVSVHDLFVQFLMPQYDINLQEVRCVQETEGERIFIRNFKFLRGSTFQYELI